MTKQKSRTIAQLFAPHISIPSFTPHASIHPFKRRAGFKRCAGFAISILMLTACGGGEPEPTPTLSMGQIQTQAVATFSFGLTQTALAQPTATPAPTHTSAPLVTFAPLATNTAGTPSGAATSNAATACYRLAFAADVTVPDNTQMTPGQTFTKTWKVTNTGTCAWDAGFKFTFTGGIAMNGAAYTLPSSVPPNAAIDISVAMTAPATAGTARANWRMSTAAGQFFGDEVYVLIMVGGSPATGTATATNTSAPATATTEPPTATP